MIGGLIAWAWKVAGVPTTPDPSVWNVYPLQGVWRKFFSAGFLLLFFSFSFFRLLSWQIEDTENTSYVISYRRWDIATYTALIPILLVIFFWRSIGDWYLWLGTLYIGLVMFKTAIAAGFEIRRCHSYRRTVSATEILNSIYSSSGLFWILALGYGLLVAWLSFSFPTTGDEPHYLLLTHSLVNDFDFNLNNNLENKDFLKFSWIGFPFHYLATYPNGDVYSIGYNGIFPIILSPAYVLMGRLGAGLTIAGISALMVREASLLTLDITGSPRAAWITWLVVGLTPPVIYFSQQIYPEGLAGLLILIFLRRWVRDDRHLISWGFGVMLALVATKIRFGAFSVGILFLMLFRFKTIKGRILAVTGSILFIILLFWVDRNILDGLLIYRQSLITGPILPQLTPNRMTGRAIMGLLFDQEFGLIPYMPLYAVGLIGLAWFGRLYKRPLLAFLAIPSGYVYILVTYQSPLWFAGWSMPSRYIASIVPLLGIVVGTTLSVLKRSTITVIATMVGLMVGAQVLILMVNPIYRYNLNNGTAQLLEKVRENTGSDIARFFPSMVNPTIEGNLVLIALILGIITGGLVMLIRKPSVKIGPDAQSHKTFWKSFGVGFVLTLFISLALIRVGRILMTGVVQGETMYSNAGIHFADSRLNVSVLKGKDSLSRKVIVEKGIVEFRVVAGGLSTDDIAPVLGLEVDGSRVGESAIRFGRNDWVEGTYSYFANVAHRHVLLRIILENGQDSMGVFRGAYIDRVKICPKKCGN